MSSRRQQNRDFKPSPSGTTHAKVNATHLLSEKEVTEPKNDINVK